MEGWAWLGAAVLAQWTCVTALRASNGLRRVVPAVLTFTALIGSTCFVAVALTHGLTIAVAYGIWTGAGIALAALTGIVVFGDRLARGQVGGLVLVMAGVAVLQLVGLHG